MAIVVIIVRLQISAQMTPMISSVNIKVYSEEELEIATANVNQAIQVYIVKPLNIHVIIISFQWI